jgi:hypothetical protein
MVKNLSKVFLMLCLLTVGGGIVAHAQIDSDIAIQGNVPFAFMVGDTKRPAGKYEIKALDDIANVLELRSEDGRTSVFVDAENIITKGERIESKNELVFDKVGDQYFLSQVWEAGSSSGSALVKSMMERRLTDSGGQAEKHSVAALLRHLKP